MCLAVPQQLVQILLRYRGWPQRSDGASWRHLRADVAGPFRTATWIVRVLAKSVDQPPSRIFIVAVIPLLAEGFRDIHYA